MDSACVHCFEEAGYRRRLGNILQPLGGIYFWQWPTDPGQGDAFSRSNDQIYFYTSLCFWSCNVNFECRMRAHDRGILAGWHNVGLLAVRLLERAFLYAKRSSCWIDNECWRILTVPTPPVLKYYLNLDVNCPLGTDVVSHGAALEPAEIALIRLHFPAEQGVIGFRVI